jgi:hypothetical protein
MGVTNSTVIARLDRAIQYAAACRLFSGVFGILDPRLRGDDEKMARLTGSQDV